MANNHSELEKRLWEAADDLRANSKLKSAEYSVPVLGLIFLRYADHKFSLADLPLPRQPDTGDEARSEVDHPAIDAGHTGVRVEHHRVPGLC
jgi:type I restriction enzyme M protein